MTSALSRMIAFLGGVVAGGMCVVTASATGLWVEHWEWGACSAGYDVWNALVAILGGLSAASFGAAGLVCLVHVATRQEGRVIKAALVTALCSLGLAVAGAVVNPTPDGPRCQGQLFVAEGDDARNAGSAFLHASAAREAAARGAALVRFPEARMRGGERGERGRAFFGAPRTGSTRVAFSGRGAVW